VRSTHKRIIVLCVMSYLRADNGEKEKLLAGKPGRTGGLQANDLDYQESNSTCDETEDHLKLKTYANLSYSDVQKKGKRAVHPTT